MASKRSGTKAATQKTKQSDEALIRACLSGDEAAWEALILKYRRLIYSIPVSYRIRSDGAEEVFQRVAVKLFENLKKLRNPGGLPAWLVVTARRECQAQLRDAHRWDALDEDGPTDLAEDPPDVPELLSKIQQEHALALAIERMDPRCRELITMLYLEDPCPSYQVISRRLGRPIGSLGPTRIRCLKKLKTFYLQLGEDPGW